MPESEEDRQKRVLKELEGKNIAHYSVLLSAWIQTKMERDKTLVTLSSAAIGLLITVLTTVGVQNVYEIILFFISVCAFLTTIYSALIIYQLNSKHVEDALRGSSTTDPNLEKYDKLSTRAFIVGAIFALFVGMTSAYQKITLKENKMSNEENKVSKTVMINDSLNGIAGLNPKNIETKSINGITNLNPEAIQQQQQTETTPEQEQSTTTDDNSSDSESD